MARNRVTSAGYNFINGSREITITDSSFAGFTREDIRLIINETQKVVYFYSIRKTNATVSGNVITIDSSFPPLVTGDELTIEMDLGFVGVDSIISEINSGKKLISDAINLKGVSSDPTDSFEDLADQIIDITGDITVTPLSTNPSWHDLAFEVANFVDFTRPYAFAILLDPTVESIALTGADAYKVSDGRIITENQTITFGPSEEGREDKITKYVIYRKADPYMTQNYADYSPSLVRLLLGAFNLNMDLSTLNFNGVRMGFFINGSELTNPIIYEDERKLLALQSSQFANNPALNTFIFPPIPEDATDAERVLTIPGSFMINPTGLHSLGFPLGLKTLTISGASAFANATNLTSLIFPKGLETLTISGNSAFVSSPNIKSIIFPEGLQSLTISGADTFSASSVGGGAITSVIFPSGLKTIIITGIQIFRASPNLLELIFPTGLEILTFTSGNGFLQSGLNSIFLSNPSTTLNVSGLLTATAVTRLELENNWNWTVSLTFANLTAVNTKELMLDKLVDKRFDGTNDSLVTTDTSSPIVTDTNDNGNFLELFRVGDTINIAAAGNRTIASIESRNQLTLTANAATTGTGQTYNMNKTLTLNATVKTRLETDYGANWADPYTAKGWTIA
jgi:hypothetical protein